MKRYITTLAILFIALVLLSASAAADGPARVLLGGRELVASQLPTEIEGEVYIPQSMLESLGASCQPSDEPDSVSVTGADGNGAVVNGRVINGSLMLPVSKVAEAINAHAEWDEKVRAVRLMAKVVSTEFVESELRINSTLPVASSVTEWKDAARIIVDIKGAKLAAPASEVFINNSGVQRARLGQMNPETVRVVLDLHSRMGFRRTSPPIAAQTVVKVSSNMPATPTSPVEVNVQPPTPTGALSGITVEPIDGNKLIVRLAIKGKVGSQTMLSSEPMSVNIELLKAQLDMPAEDIPVDHPLVRLIRIEDRSDVCRVSVVMNTNRYVAYEVNNTDGEIVVSIRLPAGAGGRLSQKTIIIDPGHGGKQTGTRAGGCLEKNINLQIAKRVHRILQEEGARAVMTRDGDHALASDLLTDLKARPALARKVGADMFVSIHCNSGNAAINGTETYYHMSAPSGRALATAIQAHVVRATGMKNRKAKSDSVVAPGKGFVVLRYSPVPAALIETGFLSNNSDKACLIDPEFQERMARGIVNGIKAYVEGTP